jgi:hypothetical protein
MEAPSPYVLARRTLLDALQALGIQRAAVILCGAQAIYLQVGDSDFAVSPYTVDADLLIASDKLASAPAVDEAMKGAGFRLRDQPGLWFSEKGIEVDLLVPEAIAGAGRRSARLGAPHGDRTAMKVRGLEGVLIDNQPRSIGALEASDNREFEIAVAGPAALLVSKLHKIAERADTPSRSMDKDALDVLRILRGTSTDDLGSSIRRLRDADICRVVTEESLVYLDQLFRTPSAVGVRMVVRATAGLENPDEMSGSCTVLAGDLLDRLA